MAYQSLSSHGILAVLGMTAHHSLQPGLFSGLTKIPTPTLMEMPPTCLNVSWLCRYYQHGPSPSEHSNRLRKSRRTIQGFVEDLGSPRTRTTRGKGLDRSPNSLPCVRMSEELANRWN